MTVSRYAIMFAAVLSGVIQSEAGLQDELRSQGTIELRQRAAESMTKGLDWLRDTQKSDGSWSNNRYPAITALGLLAFAQSDHPDRERICRDAANFVASLVQPDGGIYRALVSRRGGSLSTYNTAICMSALHLYDKAKYATEVLNARSFMARSQITGDSPAAGGFGYNQKPPALEEVAAKLRALARQKGLPEPSKAEIAKQVQQPRADLSNTGWAAYAMRVTQDAEEFRHGKHVDVDWRSAVDYVSRLQNWDLEDRVNHGGFAYDSGDTRDAERSSAASGEVRLSGFGSMTYAGLETMIFAQLSRDDPRVQAAVQWAARHWSVKANPGMGQKGLYYYYNVMAKALSLYGDPVLLGADGSRTHWREELSTQLLANQRKDGSWINPDNQFWEGDPVLVTAYTILALKQMW